MQHAVFVAEKALFELPTELFDELFLGHAETDRLARKPAVGGRSYAQCATAADQRQATDDGKPFRFHGPCVFMSDRYGSYRRDRFGFRTGVDRGPARRSIRVLLVFQLVRASMAGCDRRRGNGMAFPFGPAVFSVYPL